MDKMTVGYVAQLTAAAPMPKPGFYGCTFSSTVQIDAAELAALRKDAERYRWLRKVTEADDTVLQRGSGAELDATIDAAMLAAPAVGAA